MILSIACLAKLSPTIENNNFLSSWIRVLISAKLCTTTFFNKHVFTLDYIPANSVSTFSTAPMSDIQQIICFRIAGYFVMCFAIVNETGQSGEEPGDTWFYLGRNTFPGLRTA